MTLSPGYRIGPYEVVAKLGEGGMGEVYRAKDTNLNRHVALKILPESFATDTDRISRFKREAQVLASLNHPNIAAIYGIETNALVMELVEGEDLSTIIGRGPLSWSDALPIARQIADALEAAHEAGIIHRDLKPANIKVRADGAVKVLDFGLAKGMDNVARADGAAEVTPYGLAPTMTSPAMTQMGMVLGTAAYMAPEQARGRAVDRRADIWAFGVVLYEMLAGRRAFEGDDVSITIANVLKEEVRWPALPADLPPSVHRLLRRSLEKDPRRRLSAIGDARLELDDSTPVQTMAPTAPRSRQVLPWAIATVAILAAIYYGTIASRGATAAASVIWTSIPAPISQLGRGVGPAVSPDGRRIAFTAPGADGIDRLWIRALGAQSAQALAGTEGATNPFWSPDAESVAFFMNGKLQAVPAAGGSPRVITDASGSARGGTWNQAGVIVFVPGPGLGLHRISASAGGTATFMEAFKDKPGTLSMYPTFLPDGQRFLYTSLSDDGPSINVGSLDDGPVKVLLKVHSRATYAAGYLLFGSQGSLYAQPFDPSTLSLSGERIRVVESIGAGTGHPVNYSFSVSADGSVVAVANRPYLMPSRLTWFDRSGARLGALGDAGHLFGFSVAPDRAQVVLEKLDTRANSIDPWIMQVDSAFTAPLRPVSEGALSSSPIWSHDGRTMFFSSGYGTLKVAPVAGGPEEGWPVGAHWPMSSSPDGTALLINQQGATTGNDLMIVSLTGDHTPKPWLQTPFDEKAAHISPSGKSVAYVSNVSGRDEIYLQSFPQPGTRIPVSSNGGTHPEWNEDGSELYFAQQDPDRSQSIMVTQVLGSRVTPPRRLFGGLNGFWEGNRTGFAVFDKGRRFLVSLFEPVTTPQVITIGQNWTAGLGAKK